MTYRGAFAIITLITVSLISMLVAAWFLFFSPASLPSEPGNYVLLGEGDRCELRIIRSHLPDPIKIQSDQCKPQFESLPRSSGMSVTTMECGVLDFSMSSIPMDWGGLICSNCLMVQRQPNCPFLRFQGTALLHWKPVE